MIDNVKYIDIVSTERVNEMESWDIEIDICHAFTARNPQTGLESISHNSAGLSLSNLTDDRMRRAKSSQWWMTSPQRALCNNSVAYTEKPDLDSFSKEWRALYKSKSGERGIINMKALEEKAESCGRESNVGYGINPCGEAILRGDGGLCNLSEVVLKKDDSFLDVVEKVRIATIIGTMQSTLTDFRYLRKVWKTNAEEERLLGVSLTGVMDNKFFNNTARLQDYVKWSGREDVSDLPSLLSHLKTYAKKINALYAKKFGINKAAQVTLIKPSGTVSLRVNSAAGMHPRKAKWFIRRVRQDLSDPLTQLLINQKVPYVIYENKAIFSFYETSPEGVMLEKDVTAIQQLNLWAIYSKHWCEGNPSQTINYTDAEYFTVADWVWHHWDSIVGLAFFPKDDHIYMHPPLESITEREYNDAMKTFPKINWDELSKYEKEDSTNVNELGMACSAGDCSIL